MKRPPRQVLLRTDEQCGKSVIRRGCDGNGYTWEGEFNNGHMTGRFFFPVCQDTVSDIFKSQGKVWRHEEVNA